MKFFLVLAVIAVIVFVVLRKKPKKGHKNISDKASRKRISQASASKHQANFHSTQIVPGDNACQAAQDLQGRHFLDSELDTPNLPLPGCTQVSDCHCKYEHQADRRSYEDERRLHTLQTELYPAAEGSERRRQKRGRRSTD